ncbi:hypothetical protein V8C86DRAFT_2746911 [Haematococcus lacustris]
MSSRAAIAVMAIVACAIALSTVDASSGRMLMQSPPASPKAAAKVPCTPRPPPAAPATVPPTPRAALDSAVLNLRLPLPPNPPSPGKLATVQQALAAIFVPALPLCPAPAPAASG